jgi:uncharacterized RDD family membrane protein YckC
MNHGKSGRPPPRRPALAGRLICLACISVLALALFAGPASAYPCGPPGATRSLSGHVPRGALKKCEPSRPILPRRGNADPVSFAFYLGLTLAVLLVPVAFWRRENAPPQ